MICVRITKNEQRHGRFRSFFAGASGDTGIIISDVGIVISGVVGDDIIVVIWVCIGYTVLLCYTLFKTGGQCKKACSERIDILQLLNNSDRIIIE